MQHFYQIAAKIWPEMCENGSIQYMYKGQCDLMPFVSALKCVIYKDFSSLLNIVLPPIPPPKKSPQIPP
ncbi:hypothetical protein FKM82_012002 [Ascaphus truei]